MIGSGEGFARTFPIVCLITIMTLSQVKSCHKDKTLNNSFYISLKIIISLRILSAFCYCFECVCKLFHANYQTVTQHIKFIIWTTVKDCPIFVPSNKHKQHENI